VAEENSKYFSQKSRFFVRNFKPGTTENEIVVLTTRPRSSVAI
jgi:hypothetical protein